MLKLLPPGKRSPFWSVRGRHGGRLLEVSTRTTDAGLAKQRYRELLRTLGAKEPGPAHTVGFAEAARAYLAFRDLDDRQRADIQRLSRELGDTPCAQVTQAQLVDVANRLFPAGKASSKNRLVITPASAILHYASQQGWCPWRRISRFREAKPVTRALSQPDAHRLMAAAAGEARALLEVLFGTGLRISDVLALRWDQIDMGNCTLRLRIGKTQEDRVLPLSPLAMQGLHRLPRKPQERLWSVRDRWAAYDMLSPARERSGVDFTPHMARHSVGSWLNDAGAGLKTIMATLGHADPKSSMRYQDADVETIRRAWGRVGAVGARGGNRGSRQKAKA